MKKVGFITLGCKVNIYESNALKNLLNEKGFLVVEPSADCDVFIINTCSVTNMADAKSRKMIHRCIKLNPEAIVCAMGVGFACLQFEGSQGDRIGLEALVEGDLLVEHAVTTDGVDRT